MGLFSRLSRRRVPPPPPEGVIADLHAAGFPVTDVMDLATLWAEVTTSRDEESDPMVS